MRNVLTVLTDELRRLKATGVKTVPVSDGTLAALRAAVVARAERRSAGVTEEPSFEAPPERVEADPSPPASRISDEPAAPAKPAKRAAAALPPPPPFELPAGDKSLRWNALQDLVRNDPVCRSHVRPGKQVVLGVGNLDAAIMFVGEAPGADEEVKGEPFVGPAGQLLDRMIGAMGIKRADVYIGNIMNWRPDLPAGSDGIQYGNRPPTADEMAYCLPYLRAQVEIVAPTILVALGATAAQGLLGAGVFKALGEVRGQWRDFAGRPLMVTYHPSYILRNPINRQKRLIWEDFLKVMARAELPITDKQRGYFLEK